jgi:hypothetical protein
MKKEHRNIDDILKVAEEYTSKILNSTNMMGDSGANPKK